MGRGLDSFDAFDWPSLLAGQDILVVDRERRRGLKTANALENAGARATLCETLESTSDRLLRARYRLMVMGLAVNPEPGDAALFDLIDQMATPVLIMVDKLRQEPIKQRLAGRQQGLRLVEHGIGERDLVFAITGSLDE